MHNIVYILIVLVSSTFADVAFVTKPPEEVRTFPGQHVTLPCALENLTNTQIVEWRENSSIIKISENRDIFTHMIENIGKNYSITGTGMNFSLLFKIPDNIEFNSKHYVTTLYNCSVLKPDGHSTDISAASNVIIQRLEILHPICGLIETYYVIGKTIKLGCYHSDPTIITTLKSGNGQVLPTYLDVTSYIIYILTLTKGDHNAIFYCESRRIGTNEMRNCSIGPITVNYKPEINITKTSQTEFHCTVEARPPVNETHWIMEPSIPQDTFTISNGVLRIIKPSKVESELKITCEAENLIGKGNKTLSIPTVNNRDEEDGNRIIPTVKNRDEVVESSIIPTVNRNKDDGIDSTSLIVVVICVVAFLIILLFLIRKRIKHQHTSKSRKTSARFKSDDPQVELKKEDSKGLVYDYAAIDVNDFRADYQETENEIYFDGDMVNSEESNAVKKQSHTELKNLDQIRDNVNKAQPNTDCEELKNEQQVYSQVNKPDYKECENEIYQSPE